MPVCGQVDFLTSLLGFKALGNRASSTADSAQVAGLSLPGCTQHDFPGKYPPQVSSYPTCNADLLMQFSAMLPVKALCKRQQSTGICLTH